MRGSAAPQVPEEESLAELRQRYAAFNAHARSYIFKAMRPVGPAGAGARASVPPCSASRAAGCAAPGGHPGDLPPGPAPPEGQAPGCAAGSGELAACPEAPLPGPADSRSDAGPCEAAARGVSAAAERAPAEYELVELDLNRTLAENGVLCHGGAAGGEPVLLLYWTDDLTSFT